MVFIKAQPGIYNIARITPYVQKVLANSVMGLFMFWLHDAPFLPITINRNDLFDMNFTSSMGKGLWNMLLFLFFGFSHSAMISRFFKDTCVAIWDQLAFIERGIYGFTAVGQIAIIMLFWQPMPYVIFDYTNQVTFIISVVIAAFIGISMQYVNKCQGEGDVDGFGLVRHMSEKGVEYPIQISWSYHKLYDYVHHPMYKALITLMITQGTVLTSGRLLANICFISYAIIGGKIEDWRHADKAPPKNKSS